MIARALGPLMFAGIALAAVPAHAADPGLQCGQTITGAAHLDADLRCSQDALTLAPGASLDLGGHALIGPAGGKHTPTRLYRGIGITIPDPRGVAITNGTIRDWQYGIRSDARTPNGGTVTLAHLVVKDTTFGVWADWVAHTAHTPSPVLLQISDSTFVYSQDVSLDLIYASATVHRSYFKARRGGNSGLRISHGVLHLYNSTFQTTLQAVYCFDSACEVNGNVMRDGEYGLVIDNEARDPADPPRTVNATANRFTRLGLGVYSTLARDPVRVTGNRFWQTGTGVSAKDTDLQLIGNSFTHGYDGLSWFGGLGLVRNNVFDDFDDDGVYIATGSPAESVGDNSATDNDGYGIYAAGVTDLGGNTASGNGDGTYPQCVGVVCG